ncbi:MAG: bifunctional oligoribonuclease/PAP phosphatase NrnA [Firmicutes bacterium]|nr:bifunctional oligoribonuclease/PAP phosphatase NrnA [Bacillota bacterium]
MSKITRDEFARQFARFIGKYDRFLISGHIRPDGDSIGACFSLGHALVQMGKEVLIITDGDAKRYVELMDPLPMFPEDRPVKDAQRLFATGRNYAFVILDCSEPERTGRAAQAIMYAEASITIDHHITSKEAADFNYAEPQISSASELLYWLYKLCAVPISRSMGKALFMGLVYDTGGLRHSSTTADSFQMAADLKRKGVDTTYLTNKLLHTKKLAEMKALSAAISASRLYKGVTPEGEEIQILISYLSLGDMNRGGFTGSECDGVVSLLNEIEEAETSVFMRELSNGTIRVNMRSKHVLDVARVAALFGGGGHVRAAGCTLTVSASAAKAQLLEAMSHQLSALEGIPGEIQNAGNHEGSEAGDASI